MSESEGLFPVSMAVLKAHAYVNGRKVSASHAVPLAVWEDDEAREWAKEYVRTLLATKVLEHVDVVETVSLDL